MAQSGLKKMRLAAVGYSYYLEGDLVGKVIEPTVNFNIQSSRSVLRPPARPYLEYHVKKVILSPRYPDKLHTAYQHT